MYFLFSLLTNLHQRAILSPMAGIGIKKNRGTRGPVDILILMGALVNVLVITFFLVLYFRAP